MSKRLLSIALALAVAGCGRVADLEPARGQALPQKPALASRPLTADELLTPPTYARPERVDELGRRGEPRRADRFDLPPPDGTASPPVAANEEPTQASTTGPENQDEPRR
jgi:hypothetical protein